MSSQTGPGKEKDINERDVAPGVPKYDPGIIPAETAARMEREGSDFMHIHTKKDQEDARTDDQTDSESINVTGGNTVDKEGLNNAYAIEPEMYINEPGDLRQEEAELENQRGEQLQNLNQDEEGKLTTEGDKRGKGPGII